MSLVALRLPDVGGTSKRTGMSDVMKDESAAATAA